MKKICTLLAVTLLSSSTLFAPRNRFLAEQKMLGNYKPGKAPSSREAFEADVLRHATPEQRQLIEGDQCEFHQNLKTQAELESEANQAAEQASTNSDGSGDGSNGGNTGGATSPQNPALNDDASGQGTGAPPLASGPAEATNRSAFPDDTNPCLGSVTNLTSGSSGTTGDAPNSDVENGSSSDITNAPGANDSTLSTNNANNPELLRLGSGRPSDQLSNQQNAGGAQSVATSSSPLNSPSNNTNTADENDVNMSSVAMNRSFDAGEQ